MGLAISWGLMFPRSARAGGNEVVVVYNSAVGESKTVAEYYAKARQVPRNQLFGFSLPTGQDMTRNDFRTQLQAPLADKLEAKGLWTLGDVTEPIPKGGTPHQDRRVVTSKIHYLVLCYGVPVRILEDQTLPLNGATNLPANLRANTAAVDSELTWLPDIKMAVTLGGPMRNWVYGATNEALLTPTNGILPVTRLDGPSAKIACGLVDKAMTAEREGLWGRAYFDTRGLPKSDRHYYYGDQVILGAAEIAGELGYDTLLTPTPRLFRPIIPSVPSRFIAAGMTWMFPAHLRGRRWNSCRARLPIICIPTVPRISAVPATTGWGRCWRRAPPARWVA